MRLFKFFSIFAFFLLVTNQSKCAPSQYLTCEIGGRKVYIHPRLVDSATYYGKDVVLPEAIQIGAGESVNLWQWIQLGLGVAYLFGIGGNQLDPVVSLLPDWFKNCLKNDAGEVQMSMLLGDCNDMKIGPSLTAGIYFALYSVFATIPPYRDGTCNGVGALFNSDSYIGAGAAGGWKVVENGTVNLATQLCGWDVKKPEERRSQEKLRGLVKISELALSILCKHGFKPLISWEAADDSLVKQSIIQSSSVPVACRVCNGTLKAQIEVQNGQIRDIAGLEEEHNNPSRIIAAKGELEEDQLYLAKFKKELAEGDQEEFVLGDGPMPFSSIPDVDVTDQKPQSDLAECAQQSDSMIPPVPTLLSQRPGNEGGRAALFDDIRNNKKTLNPVEQNKTEREKSDLQQGLEDAADVMKQKMEKRRNSSGYGEDDKNHSSHLESTNENNEGW